MAAPTRPNTVTPTALRSCSSHKVAACVVAVVLTLSVWGWSSDPFPTCKGCTRLTGNWGTFQRQLAKEASRESPGHIDILFLGDSITESFRGTSLGSRECSEFRCKGIPEIFASAFSAYQTLVLAISGDQTAHLKWRLAHGEGAAVKKAKVVVLLIGTNDVSQLVDTEVGGWKTPAKEKVAEATVKTSAQVMTTRIQSVVENVKAINPAVKVVLLGLLPRGQAFRPPAFEWPNGIYTEIIGELNHNLAGRYEADGSVSFVECSEAFVDTPSGRVKKSMMPDALHPSDRGMQELTTCIIDAIKPFGLFSSEQK